MLRMLALVALVVIVAGAGDGPAHFRAELRSCHGEVNTLDPQKMSWMYDLRMGRMLYSGGGASRDFLGDAEPKSVAGRGGAVDVSDDDAPPTFFRGAVVVDSEPVREISDFVFSWRRRAPGLQRRPTAMFQLIEGGEEFSIVGRPRWKRSSPGDDAEAGQTCTFDEMECGSRRSMITRSFTSPVPVRTSWTCAGSPCFSRMSIYWPNTTKRPRRHGADHAQIGMDSQQYWSAAVRCRDGVAISSVILRSRSRRIGIRARLQLRHRARCVCIEDVSARCLAAVGNDRLALRRRGLVQVRHRRDRRVRGASARSTRCGPRGWTKTTIDGGFRMIRAAHPRVPASFGTYFYNFNCSPRSWTGGTIGARIKRVARALRWRWTRSGSPTRRRPPRPRAATPSSFTLPRGLVAALAGQRPARRGAVRGRQGADPVHTMPSHEFIARPRKEGPGRKYSAT